MAEAVPSVSHSLPSVILSFAWKSYLQKLESDPLLTKVSRKSQDIQISN